MLGNYSTAPRLLPGPWSLVKGTVYLSVPAALWVAANYETLRDYFGARQRLDERRRELRRDESEHARLIEEKKQLDSGGFLTEKAIRERYMMVLPGETVIRIENGEPVAPAASTPSPAPGFGSLDSASAPPVRVSTPNLEAAEAARRWRESLHREKDRTEGGDESGPDDAAEETPVAVAGRLPEPGEASARP